MSRTNFVKVSNLPPSLQTADELHETFSSCGVIQDLTAVDATTVIVSYAMRSHADFAKFALDNVKIGGELKSYSTVKLTKAFRKCCDSVKVLPSL